MEGHRLGASHNAPFFFVPRTFFTRTWGRRSARSDECLNEQEEACGWMQSASWGLIRASHGLVTVSSKVWVASFVRLCTGAWKHRHMYRCHSAYSKSIKS